MPQREGVIYPKFREQFAVADFEADPMPVLSLYPTPAPLELSELQIQTCGIGGERRTVRGQQLQALPRRELKTSLVCQVFNWSEPVEWVGVRLADFLEYAGLEAPGDGWPFIPQTVSISRFCPSFWRATLASCWHTA